jgi:dTDP-4-amino-4,6-dideoxygalactose transaminase
MPLTANNEFIVFGAPLIGEEEIAEVVDSLRSGWIGTGPKVARFEKDFADYKGVSPDRVVAVNSCTAALHLSLIAAGVGPGDEVITTPLTFCATVNAIIHTGATPVLADVDPKTMNIAPTAVRDAVSSRTKAILPVHFAGRPCAMQELTSIAEENGLLIIEDCAHAVESRIDDKASGTIGDFGCFSFYVTKNMTCGEGGMVIAKDADICTRIKRLSLHGLSAHAWERFGASGYKHYYVEECGFKYNMTDMQAAIGIQQLKRLEQFWKRRKAIWERYQDELALLPIQLPGPCEASITHGYHLYTIRISEKASGISRDNFLEKMREMKIGLGVHYIAIPEHPYYQSLGFSASHYPNASQIGNTTVSLPISARLRDSDIERIISSTKNVILKR